MSTSHGVSRSLNSEPSQVLNGSVVSSSSSRPSLLAQASVGIRPPSLAPNASVPSNLDIYLPSNCRYFCFGIIQLLGLWLLYAFTAFQIGVPWQIFLSIRHINQNSQEDTSFKEAAILFLWIMPAYSILFPLSLLVTIIVKWLLIGRYKEGKYKLWSFYYFRWWMVQRLVNLVPLVYLRGSLLMNLYARLMGAKLGKNVYLNSFHFDAWDLCEIDDFTSIGCDAHLANFTVKNGYLYIHRIKIGKKCYVGARSIITGACELEDEAQVGSLSLLTHGTVVKKRQYFKGAPAKMTGSVQNDFTFNKLDERDIFDEHTTTYSSSNSSNSNSNHVNHTSESSLSLSQDKSQSQSLLDKHHSGDYDVEEDDTDKHLAYAPSTCRLFSIFLFQMVFLFVFLAVIILVAAIPGLIILHFLMDLPNSDLFPSVTTGTTPALYILAAFLMATTFVILFLIEITILKFFILRKSDTSRQHSIYSCYYVRKWCVDILLQLSLHTVYTMYATMYLAPWFRTLGAKLGSWTEISTVADTIPDLVEIGDGCFVADSVYLGVATIHMGRMRVRPIKVGSHTFLGNSAMVNIDTTIGSECLIGVMSTPPSIYANQSSRTKVYSWPEEPSYCTDGTSYLGSPPMLLPRRQEAQGEFDVSSTYHPTTCLIMMRAFIEFLRIVSPFFFMIICMLLYMGNFEELLFKFDGSSANLALFWLVIWPSCYIGAAIACCFIVILLKWILIGKYVPIEAPLWSTFVWRSELVTGVMEALCNPFFINHLRGTPILCWWFRLLGSTIGNRVWMDSTQITEPDLIVVGDDVCIGEHTTLQTHLFEDRIMKLSFVTVETFCSIGAMSVVLYDSCMKEGAHLGDLSLLMKGETLPSFTQWEGIPAQRSKHQEL